MGFPQKRLRRLRANQTIRDMVRETILTKDDLIQPYFICTGKNIKREISSMPGNYNYSIDKLLEDLKVDVENGVKSILLFGIPSYKDSIGSSGYDDDGVVQNGIKEIKKSFPELYIISDVCNCEYTDHGHCGIIKDNDVDNDSTLSLLVKQAISHAKAGVDMVAPSDMMDGRIAAIREGLDTEGFSDIPIMSYSAKYASAFYGPFRDAADSTPTFGDRKTYQMDPANSDEALREMELDVEEGADIIMVKPALSYLDIIRRGKDSFNIPMAAYNVSGEFSMVKAAAKAGYIDEDRIVMEILTSIKRAGAEIIISYHTKEVVQHL